MSSIKPTRTLKKVEDYNAIAWALLHDLHWFFKADKALADISQRRISKDGLTNYNKNLNEACVALYNKYKDNTEVEGHFDTRVTSAIKNIC